MTEGTIEVIKDIYPLGLCGCTEEELINKAKELKHEFKGLELQEQARQFIRGISKYKAQMKKSKGKKPTKKC